MNVKSEKDCSRWSADERIVGQSIKIKSHCSRLVSQRVVEAECVLVEPGYGRGSILVCFSLSLF